MTGDATSLSYTYCTWASSKGKLYATVDTIVQNISEFADVEETQYITEKKSINISLSSKPSPGGYCVSLLWYLSLSPSSGRLWDCMRSVLRMQDSVADLGAAVMQQADVAALWLLEALVLTLPQSLLQAYVVVSTDVGIMSPGKLISP